LTIIHAEGIHLFPSTHVRKFDDEFFWTNPVPRQPQVKKSPEGGLPRGNIEVSYSGSACFLGETSKKDRREKKETVF
jgi:hypothetical protein